MTRRKLVWIWVFLLPAVLLFSLVFAVPLMTVILTSFSDWHMLGSPSFSGLTNYISLFTRDADFLVSIKNTLIWVLIQSTLHVGFGVLVALILSEKLPGWKFVRTVYMFPNIISTAALGIMFLNIFHPQLGLINSIIRALGFSDFQQNWFGDDRTAFWTIVSIQLPYAAVICILVLSELASVSESIFESAAIDGATNFQVAWYIKLPMLRNIIGTGVIIAATSIISSFDMVYLITRGGPGNATLTMSLLLYNNAMRSYDFGRANAIGVAQLLIGILVIGLITRLFRVGESVEDRKG